MRGISRRTIVAMLLAIEIAIGGEAIVAVRSGQSDPPAVARLDAPQGPPAALVAGAPARTFTVGAHPVLTVDIGYADLTVLADAAGQIAVSVSDSHAFGMMPEHAPISARVDHDTIHIAATTSHDFSLGDDRMVTVRVPPNTTVTVVNAGDITANGLQATSSFHSVGRGSITIGDYDAPSLDATSSGRISLHQVSTNRLMATSTDDRVDGIALHVHDGMIEGDGRVTLGFAPGTDTLVTAETDDGRVSIAGSAAPTTVSTGKRSDDDSASQTVRIGSATGHLDVHTSTGNITLTQEGIGR
jgi:hypothetical protein